ncbi:PrsW family intramembrane metalloprotease [Modestobacter marinus]|uniref:PrsW family intramembrane metalloprotease n=1 Tax=Modestobacter marinus TaxID=477641 RepID=UPI001C976F31|nr:PrsW family glutamic-type intramembrane protease [Modestobacter marinus]
MSVPALEPPVVDSAGAPLWSRGPRHTMVSRTAGQWPVLARRWSWLLVVVGGFLLYELVRQTLLDTKDPLYAPTLILVGSAVVPVAFVTFVSARRLVFGVGGVAVALTTLLGGVIGVVAAGTLEFETRRSLGVLPMFAVGLIEELAKLLVPAVALLVLRRGRRPADGLLLGVAAGAGFALLETMGYAFVALVRSGGNLTVVNDLILDRSLLSPAAHMAWTGLLAAALWRAAAGHWRGRAVARLAGTYFLVAALHAAWDSTGSGWVRAALSLVGLGLLAWTAHRLAAPDRASREAAGYRLAS